MKQIIKKMTAVLCSGMIICSSFINASAEENVVSDDIVLPSGITLTDYQHEMKKLSENEKYASALVGVF